MIFDVYCYSEVIIQRRGVSNVKGIITVDITNIDKRIEDVAEDLKNLGENKIH